MVEESNNIALSNYYIENFNNVRFLDVTVSKWGLYDLAKSAVYEALI